jgi:hypothetical protein
VSYLSIKAGASLDFDLVFTGADGAPVDLTAGALTMQIRDSTGAVVGTPTITLGSSPGTASGNVPGSVTQGWPVGVLRTDISLALPGVTLISDTATITVAAPVTRP